MRTWSSNYGLLVAALVFSTGCATIVNRSTQPVTIVSDPLAISSSACYGPVSAAVVIP